MKPEYRAYALYGSTIFLSSFLLFMVQPLLSKHFLPWFGGGAAIWVTAMLFFTCMLAVGYGYVLVLARFRVSVQVMVHSILMGGALLSLVAHGRAWPSPITPSSSVMEMGGDPSVLILTLLWLSVGIPFVVLSGTSSLLQEWYARVEGKEPFTLYAVSNVGSLLGLLVYPFVVEPLFGTVLQGTVWTVGFGVYFTLLALVMMRVVLRMPVMVRVVKQYEAPRAATVSLKVFLLWVGFAGVPVMAMLMGTAHLTTVIAPLPFLWVLPLALYLLSFVVTFQSRVRIPHAVGYSVALLCCIAALACTRVPPVYAVLQIPIVLGALFSIYHLFHEHLYTLRPASLHLTYFYGALSVGGVLAALSTVLISYYVLTIPIEFILLLGGVTLFAAYGAWVKGYVPVSLHERHSRMLFRASVFLVCILLVGAVYKHAREPLVTERNFYGFKGVYESVTPFGERHTLLHGVTVHGYEYQDAALRMIPTSYYATSSLLGQTMDILKTERAGMGLRVAVIGLGGGMIAAYCEPGDQFDFYEIDPEVVSLARTQFDFLDTCAGSTVHVGDGRLLMEASADSLEGTLDALIIDAYADDAVPQHLMTKEAFAFYQQLVKPDGVILVHLSSRYLDLRPVIASHGDEDHLTSYFYYDRTPSAHAVVSLWGMLAEKNGTTTDRFASLRIDPPPEKRVHWTDTHSSILPILKWWE